MSESLSWNLKLLQRALDGHSSALGELLDRHRAFLKLLTRGEFDGFPDAAGDESDVVQQASLSAVRAFGEFRGQTVGEFVAWLKQIHHRTASDLLRRHYAGKRGGGAHRLPLPDDQPEPQPTPSQRLLMSERAGELAAAIEALPEDQREAVRLRHLEGWSLDAIARRMDRTEAAAAGLVKRGLSALRSTLKE